MTRTQPLRAILQIENVKELGLRAILQPFCNQCEKMVPTAVTYLYYRGVEASTNVMRLTDNQFDSPFSRFPQSGEHDRHLHSLDIFHCYTDLR